VLKKFRSRRIMGEFHSMRRANMTKSARSAKGKSSVTAGKVRAASKGKTKASRAEVRQEVHRTQVPRQSQRPAERSHQRRSSKP
jgi:hypothetical protein